MNDLLLTSFSG